MAVFKTTIVGTIIDLKVSKKGKRYLKIYDGDSLHNVFVDEGTFNRFEKGEEAVLPCNLFTDEVYLKFIGEGEK